MTHDGGPCECAGPGWCERHLRTKVAAQWRLCQTRQDYRDLWDAQAQAAMEDGIEVRPPDAPYIPTTTRRLKVGQLVKSGLRLIGIKPCGGCDKRAKTLDRVAGVRIPFGGQVEDTEFHYVAIDAPPGYNVKDDEWAIGVTTAPRATVSLPQSLASLWRAGFRDVRIFAEPGSVVPQCDGVVENPARFGVFQNWFRSLRRLREEKPAARFYAIFQDDVVYCRGLREFLANDLWFADNIGFVSPYRSEGKMIAVGKGKRVFRPSDHYIDATHGRRQKCRKGNGLWGACTYVMPRESVDLLLADPSLQVRERMIDLAIHVVLAQHGRDAWYYCPSLADTMRGIQSSIGHGAGGRGMSAGASFVGEEFDVRAWL